MTHVSENQGMVDDTNLDRLIELLHRLSPMPADDDPALTAERLDQYADVVQNIDDTLGKRTAEADAELIRSLVHSFGYGDGYEVYWSTLHTLEKLPLDKLHFALREALQTGERGARMWCAFMLGRMRDPRDVSILVAALKDPEFMVRTNALRALAMIGDLSAASAMETLLNDPIEAVRNAANELLAALRDQRYVVRRQQ